MSTSASERNGRSRSQICWVWRKNGDSNRSSLAHKRSIEKIIRPPVQSTLAQEHCPGTGQIRRATLCLRLPIPSPSLGIVCKISSTTPILMTSSSAPRGMKRCRESLQSASDLRDSCCVIRSRMARIWMMSGWGSASSGALWCDIPTCRRQQARERQAMRLGRM